MAIVLGEKEKVIDYIMDGINNDTNHTLVKAHKDLIREAIMDYASMALSDVATTRNEIKEWSDSKRG